MLPYGSSYLGMKHSKIHFRTRLSLLIYPLMQGSEFCGRKCGERSILVLFQIASPAYRKCRNTIQTTSRESIKTCQTELSLGDVAVMLVLQIRSDVGRKTFSNDTSPENLKTFATSGSESSVKEKTRCNPRCATNDVLKARWQTPAKGEGEVIKESHSNRETDRQQCSCVHKLRPKNIE